MASKRLRPSAKPTGARSAQLPDWRTHVLERVRRLIERALPDVIEEAKWGGIPVWSHGGILCTGETYANVVKLTFAKGAALADPARLFNASLEGTTRRAIDIREGDAIDERALAALVRAAAAWNAAGVRRAAPRTALRAGEPKGKGAR